MAPLLGTTDHGRKAPGATDENEPTQPLNIGIILISLGLCAMHTRSSEKISIFCLFVLINYVLKDRIYWV